MRMFLFFLLLVLLIPLNGYAVNPCHGLDLGQCTAKAGCYFANECVQCKKKYYCPSGDQNQKLCSTVGDGTFDLSETGATEPEDCYKKVDCIHYSTLIQCKSYYDGLTDCDNGMVSNNTVHFENDQCYTGYLDCDQFNTNCNGTVSGSAKWDKSKNEWHTVSNSQNRCRCESSYENETCTGLQYSLPHYTQQYISIGDTINFQFSGYKCTQCKIGYYVNAATDINSDHEDDDCENDKVCKCTIVPQGSYINGQCSQFPDTINPNTNICQPNPCPAGQTTNGPGATAPTDCHYTGDTKFCDAGGCFTLDNIQTTYAINPTTWQAQ